MSSVSNLFDFSNHRVLVTGGTGGIGSEIVRKFCASGAFVYVSDRDERALTTFCQEFGSSVEKICCDLSNKNEIESMCDYVTSGSRLDILINCAGITRDSLLIKMTEEEWDDVININLRSAFIICRKIVRHMIGNKYGRIINISSVVGLVGNVGQSNYAASKAAIIGMSKSIAREVASRNITVNCVAPGYIITPMTSVLSDDNKNKIMESIPSKKFGEPIDVSNATLFLASKESRYITGVTLNVDGGMYM